MKKISKIITAFFLYILSLVYSVQYVFADLVIPGQESRPPFVPNNQNKLILYSAVGGIIVLVIVISIIFLIKIRKGNVNK